MATILIVDDRLDNRELLTKLLGYAGHQPLGAATAQEALAIARAERLDLIVTDIIMPTMDGYEFAQTMRSDPQLKQMPVVFYTSAHVVAEARRLAEACGVAHIIVKPAPPDEILQTIDQALHSEPPPIILPASEAFHQEQMRLLTDKLAATVDELEIEVAERRRAERALQSSEAELRALFSAIRDLILVLDADGTFLTIAPTNPPASYRPAPQLIGRRLHDSFTSELADQFVAHIRRALDARQPVPFEYSQVINDQTVWFEATISPMGPNVAFMIARDNTARKQAESAMLASEAHLRNLFENAPISIWEEDFSAVKNLLDNLAGGPPPRLDEYLDSHPEVVAACVRLVKVIAVNRATLELLDAPDPTGLLGGLATTLISESRAVFQAELLAIASGLSRLKMDATVQTRAGQRRDVTMYWSVVPGYEQNYSRVLVSLVDITDRKRAEQATARQLERLSALRSIDVAISASLDLPSTLEIVLDQVMSQLQVDGADLFLINPATRSVDYAAGRGFRSETRPKISLPLGQEYAGRVALERRTLAVPDFDRHKTKGLRVASL
ncbi:MAG: response regulator [Anaerolineales bacterium]